VNSVETVAVRLLEHVHEGAAYDLRFEDPIAAINRHFDTVRIKALPNGSWANELCLTDGWYDAFTDTSGPWILFSAATSPRRARFTIVHELGHHLLQTSASSLLDDIDLLGDENGGAENAEERVCNYFAGLVLLSDEQLHEVIGDGLVLPEHVIELYRHGAASLEATAMRVANYMKNAGAVVIMRSETKISFCASSSFLDVPWWKRDSDVDPNGPLAASMRRPAHAAEETFRWGRAYARHMYCDVLPVKSDLAVAILCDSSSAGSPRPLTQDEPRWKEEISYCMHCTTGERTVGWCVICNGPFCRECERCGCMPIVDNPRCPRCRLRSPMRPGSSICRDCELG
jgi:hypothetical protein